MKSPSLARSVLAENCGLESYSVHYFCVRLKDAYQSQINYIESTQVFEMEDL